MMQNASIFMKNRIHYDSTPKGITFSARLCDPFSCSHTTTLIEKVNCSECLKLLKEKEIK